MRIVRNRTYPCSFGTQIFRNGLTSHEGECTISEQMSSTEPLETLTAVAALLATTIDQGNNGMSHKLWNVI